MIILLKLILAHLVGDFLLQPGSWVRKKQKNKLRSVTLYLHIAVHGALVLLLLWDFHYWHLALSVMMVHGVIDIVKLCLQNDRNRTQWFLADQFLHVASLVILYSIWFRPQWDWKALLESDVFWIYTTSILFITVVAGIIIQELLRKWSDQLTVAAETDESGMFDSLKHAGKYIGILERLLTFLFIIINQWAAIGFLLAAKSVFRFGDLKESKSKKLTEYILIGTLLSFGMAIAAGVTVRYLL